jgi:hypothetical protein
MFHYFKIPYFTYTFFTKFTYNEYIGPYFFIERCSTIFASDLPEPASKSPPISKECEILIISTQTASKEDNMRPTLDRMQTLEYDCDTVCGGTAE